MNEGHDRDTGSGKPWPRCRNSMAFLSLTEERTDAGQHGREATDRAPHGPASTAARVLAGIRPRSPPPCSHAFTWITWHPRIGRSAAVRRLGCTGPAPPAAREIAGGLHAVSALVGRTSWRPRRTSVRSRWAPRRHPRDSRLPRHHRPRVPCPSRGGAPGPSRRAVHRGCEQAVAPRPPLRNQRGPWPRQVTRGARRQWKT
jgi:hypothetical protein